MECIRGGVLPVARGMMIAPQRALAIPAAGKIAVGSAFKPAPASRLRAAPRARRAAVLAPARASLTVKEAATGVEFPLVLKLWHGEEYRALGAGVRTKKIAFLGVKVYAVALYVEAEKAAKELGVRDRGGFFESDDDFCSALMDGGFGKALVIELVRDVEGAAFVEALNEALKPRMALAGELAVLDQFRAFFEGRKLAKRTAITLLYRPEAVLDVSVRAEQGADLSGAAPELSLPSASLCRALFEVYMGSSPVIPEAKGEWAKGARALLESDKVRRDTRKS